MALFEVDDLWFSWDDKKSERNFRIRGFNFEAAVDAFFDEYAEFSRNMEWKGEERYQVVGSVPNLGVIVVIFSIWYFEETDEKVHRIISARQAEPPERKRYLSRFSRI